MVNVSSCSFIPSRMKRIVKAVSGVGKMKMFWSVVVEIRKSALAPSSGKQSGEVLPSI